MLWPDSRLIWKITAWKKEGEKCFLFSPSDCWSVTAAVIRWSCRQVCVKSETSTTRGGLENNKNDHWLQTTTRRVFRTYTTRTTHGFLFFFKKAELLRSRYWRRENKVMAASSFAQLPRGYHIVVCRWRPFDVSVDWIIYIFSLFRSTTTKGNPKAQLQYTTV
jgi:hypothetical protein